MADAQALIGTLGRFSERTILLIGESILDRYLKGSATGICREAPVPVVGLNTIIDAPGGAANTARNMSRLGGQVRFVSVVGADHFGLALKQLLRDQGVDTRWLVTDSQRRTLVKQRLRCDDQLVARFDDGDTDVLSEEKASQVAAALHKAAPGCDGMVVSDYDLGLMAPAVLEALQDLCAQGLPVLVDSKRLERYHDIHPWVVKPNFGEVLKLLGVSAAPSDRARFVEAAQGELFRITGAESFIVTLDRDGAVLCGPQGPYRTAGRSVPAAFAAGAGDTFVSALALALFSDAPMTVAMDLAAAAADLILDHDGTTACGRDVLERELAGQGKYLRDATQIEEAVGRHRARHRRLVFTNGCFDILHRGHITYLERAKALGDVLIVGLNGDASVTRLKGFDRPMNTLADRIAVVAALGCVDHVVSFDDDTAHAPIRLIRPDIFVKGGDYAAKTLPEVDLVEELGGRVRLLEYIDNRSTSGLIERIRGAARTG